MIVLNIQGDISPICISEKLKLYISNLPSDDHNDWNTVLCSELQTSLQHSGIIKQKISTEQQNELRRIYENYFPQNTYSEEANEDTYIQDIVDRMTCIYFNYDDADMPMFDWTTNCFDGRISNACSAVDIFFKS